MRGRTTHLAAILSVGLVLSAATVAPASTYYWDNNSNVPPWGGGGTWNTTTSNWAASTTSPYGFTTWGTNNGLNTNKAVFQGTGGTVSLGVANIYANALQFDADGYTIQSNTLNLVNASSAITVTNSSDTATISSIVYGTVGLTKSGSGKLVLSGNNTYLLGGGTTVNGGTVSISVDNSTTHNLGNTGYGVTLAGGTLEVTGDLYAAGNNTLTRTITLGTGGGTIINLAPDGLYVGRGSGTPSGGAVTGGTGLTTKGEIILFPIFQNTLGTLTVASGRTSLRNDSGLSYPFATTDKITVKGGASLLFTDHTPRSPNNTITFESGANITTRIHSGYTTTMTLANAVLPTAGTMIFNNDDQATDTITISKALALTGDLTIQVGGNNATVGDVTLSGAISGSGGLTKTQSGNLILSAANTYNGNTTISGGTLKLALGSSTNNIASSPTINVASGATLDTTGLSGGKITLAGTQTLKGGGSVLGGVITQSGSHVAPGASVGTLTTATLSMASGSIYDFEFNTTPANDKIIVTTSGGLTINGGGFNLYNEGFTTAFATGGTYSLISYTGTLGGTGVGALSVLNPQPGKGYTFSTASNWVKLLIEDLNNSWLTMPTPVTLRMMKNGSGTPGSLNITNTSATYAGDYTATGTAGTDVLTPSPTSGTVAASGTAPLGFGWASTGTTGSRSGTITLTNTSNASEPNQTTSVTGAVVAKRGLSATAVTLGRVMANTPLSGYSTTLAADTTGDNYYTNPVLTQPGNTSGGVTVAAGGGTFTFNASGASTSRSVTVNFPGTGTKSGSVALTVNPEGLTDEGTYTLSVPFTATALEQRLVTQTGGPVNLGNVLLNGTASGSAGLGTTGSDNEKTRVTVASQLFNSAASTGTYLVTQTFSSYGTNSGSVNLPVTGEGGLTGEGTYAPVAVSYTANVGEATADMTNSAVAFGTALTATVATSYADLESKVYDTDGSGGAAAVGSTATILAGTIEGFGAPSPATVSMAWRTRTLSEAYPTHTSPPVPPDSFGLVSDVVNLTGMDDGTGLTDYFVLQMTYDPDLLVYSTAGWDENDLASVGGIYLAWLDPGTSLWTNAVLGNYGGTPTFAGVGPWSDSGSPGLSDDLGRWGVDLTDPTHTAWAVVNHNSQFAVVPEPATLVLLGLGGLGLILSRKRR